MEREKKKEKKTKKQGRLRLVEKKPKENKKGVKENSYLP